VAGLILGKRFGIEAQVNVQRPHVLHFAVFKEQPRHSTADHRELAAIAPEGLSDFHEYPRQRFSPRQCCAGPCWPMLAHAGKANVDDDLIQRLAAGIDDRDLQALRKAQAQMPGWICFVSGGAKVNAVG
jgi:hypothetical protein